MFFLQDTEGTGLVPRPSDASYKVQGYCSLPMSEALPGPQAQSSFFASFKSIRVLLWLAILGSIALVDQAGLGSLSG